LQHDTFSAPHPVFSDFPPRSSAATNNSKQEWQTKFCGGYRAMATSLGSRLYDDRKRDARSF